MIYLGLEQILVLHQEAIRLHGGSPGVRDLGLLDSAAAQPQMTFGGHELYPTLIEKATILGFTLIKNHGFIDGNKRVGFAALDVFLRVNGFLVSASTDDAEAITLAVAAGTATRDDFTDWVRQHVEPIPTP